MIDLYFSTQLQQAISIISTLLFILFFGIVLTHFISKFFMVKTPVKLKTNSLVVITGGCMGIGKQMALQIAKLYHCSIIIVDIKKDLFEDINSQITKLGSICQCYYCDLSDDQSVDQFISNMNERNHKIDLFIHNAGIIIPKKVLDTSQKQVMLQMKVNFLSPVKIIKQTISLMEGGHIAAIASMVTLAQGGVQISSYSASKYALSSFLTCFRQQLKQSKSNITMSIGCPYAVNTTLFTGFKTRVDFLFRWLDQRYVAKRLVKQFVQKKQVCYIYQYQAILFKLVSFLPSGFSDLFSILGNVSDFSSIRDKHKQLCVKKEKNI